MTWAGCTDFAKSSAAWSSSRRHLTAAVATSLATALVVVVGALGCGGTPARELEATETAEPAIAQRATAPEADVGPDIDPPPPVRDCEALLRSAQTDADDAALVGVLCPDLPRDEVAARARLLAAASSAEAAALVPSLSDHPELAALAKLVGHVAEPLSAGPWSLEAAAGAVVTPIDGRVLGQVQVARAMLYDPQVGVDDRTRARAYLAKVYTHAVRQLGIGPLTGRAPFARLLSGLALAHARPFCNAYWRRRVSGLSGLFGEAEFDIVRAALALEAEPGTGDPAVAIHQLDEARRYLGRNDVGTRVAARVERGGTGPVDPRRLAPGVTHLQRMLRLRFVDLATARAIHLGTRRDGPGLVALEQTIEAGLAASDGSEYERRTARKFVAAREREPRPAERGPGVLDAPADPNYAPAQAVADQVWEELTLAQGSFSQRRATGRAVLALRRRPDALLELLDRLGREDPSVLAYARPVLGAVADEFDDGNLDWLRLRVDIDRAEPVDPDAAIRREFAFVARVNGALPR